MRIVDSTLVVYRGCIAHNTHKHVSTLPTSDNGITDTVRLLSIDHDVHRAMEHECTIKDIS